MISILPEVTQLINIAQSCQPNLILREGLQALPLNHFTLNQSIMIAKKKYGIWGSKKEDATCIHLSSQCPKCSLKVKSKYGLLDTFNKKELRISRSEAMT